MNIRILLAVIIMLVTFSGNAQRSNIRIGYIDTEYILENIPEYNKALSQLDSKVQKWKGEIDLKLRDIDKKKLDLRNERVLLTKELIEEKEEEIKTEEAEILDYQQKRFGPNGDLIIQKQKLIEPIQDQVLTAVQELAKAKKYDFIFDKSADVVMLYSNKRYDLSDFIVRTITRTAKREQAKNKKAKKEVETEDVVPVINEELEAKKKAQEDNRAKRQQILEERKKKAQEAREAKKKAFEEKRKKMLEAREAKKNKSSGPPSPPQNEEEEQK
ncbi:MAG: OmpH family outer membrane protein [Flavobacteriaceae bacterium]